MNQHVAKIEKQETNYLHLKVPSKSSPGEPRDLVFYPSGKHHCSCPGHDWKVKRQTYSLPNHKKWCRHHTMNTLVPMELFTRRILHYITKGYIKAAWQFISCQFPEHYSEEQIHCSSCPLYPKYCNIHPIHFGKHLSRRPLVWRLQTAIFNKRRKDALTLFKSLNRKVKEIKNERDTLIRGES